MVLLSHGGNSWRWTKEKHMNYSEAGVCSFRLGNECKPLFILNCLLCNKKLWLEFGWDIDFTGCGVWTEWGKKDRLVEVSKVYCSRESEVKNQ